MQMLRSLLAALILVLSSAPAFAGDDLEARSEVFLAAVFSGKCEEAATMIANSSSLKAVENLADFGAGLRAALGDYKGIRKAEIMNTRNTTTVVLICDFSEGQVKVNLTYNEVGKITALTFKPVTSQTATK
ncbi:MAG: DUF3887 domain-containing protein [Chloroherpetonaceae bacterium]|nr:DUF3887 domain-containing protein [Chloroherpetonaceae bacterium]